MNTLKEIYPVVDNPPPLKVGDRLYKASSGGEYIIARLGRDKINLINLRTGNLFKGQECTVEDINAITATEIKALLCSPLEGWSLLQKGER